MYMIPDKKRDPSDYESWKEEWSKVMFDYAKYAILHVLYLRQLNTMKPFSNFQDREGAIKEIAEKLIDQDIAEWVNKKQKEQLRIYWKTLDGWAEEIYKWALDIVKTEPIMLFEIRESEQEFCNLPEDDLEEIYKIMVKKRKATIIKLPDGELAFKIRLD